MQPATLGAIRTREGTRLRHGRIESTPFCYPFRTRGARACGHESSVLSSSSSILGSFGRRCDQESEAPSSPSAILHSTAPQRPHRCHSRAFEEDEPTGVDPIAKATNRGERGRTRGAATTTVAVTCETWGRGRCGSAARNGPTGGTAQRRGTRAGAATRGEAARRWGSEQGAGMERGGA